MSVFKAVAKGFILMMFGVVITRAIGFFYKVLFSRSYGADGFGLFSIGLGFFTLLATFSIMGLNIGLSRYISMYRQKDTKKLNKIAFYASCPISTLTKSASEKVGENSC